MLDVKIATSFYATRPLRSVPSVTSLVSFDYPQSVVLKVVAWEHTVNALIVNGLTLSRNMAP